MCFSGCALIQNYANMIAEINVNVISQSNHCFKKNHLFKSSMTPGDHMDIAK